MSTNHRSAVACLAIICLVTSVHFIPSAHAADALRVVGNETGGSLKFGPGGIGDDKPNPEWVAPPKMFIEPLAGLTSARHVAPTRTSICRGTEVTLCQEVPDGATVTWRGISESARVGEESFATKQLATVGEQVIVAVVETKDGDVYENSVVFDVVDITLKELQIYLPMVVASELRMSDTMSNEETYKLYSSRESIAQFRNVSVERQSFEPTLDGRYGRRAKLPRSNTVERYRTSVSRTIQIDISTNPPGFAPLMEWRVGVVARGLGETIAVTARETGVHVISVGPPARPRQIELETYSVAIISHASGVDSVGEGEVLVFEAVTDPPGYEDEITWLSSTTYGAASTVLGHGPTFTVQFDNTFGPLKGGGLWQWLGVKADNTVFGQDQKCGELVPSVDAVFMDFISPDFYPCQSIESSQSIFVAGSTVQVQPPFTPTLPYVYGESQDFSVFFCEDLPGVRVRFFEPGTYNLRVDGTEISTVFVDVEPECDGKKCSKTGSTEDFDVSDAEIVISDKVGTYKDRWEYYEGIEQNIVEVDDVADAITEICGVDGMISKLTIANHGKAGQISAGDGNTKKDGKWLGKDDADKKLGAYQAFVDGLKDKNKFAEGAEICIIGCNVGEGDAGKKLVDCLASDLGVKVKAKKGTVTYPKRKDGKRKPQSSGETGWAEGNPE